MDTLAKLIICAVLGAFYSPTQAATYAPSWGELKVIDGDLHMTRGNGTTSIMYPDAGLSKDLNVSTSKGNFPVPVEKSLPIPPTKVAKAATRFLKTLPAIGTAIALYDTVCDLAQICYDNGNFRISDLDEEASYTQVTGGYWRIYEGSGSGGSNGNRNFEDTYANTLCVLNTNGTCTFYAGYSYPGAGGSYDLRVVYRHCLTSNPNSCSTVDLRHYGGYEPAVGGTRPANEADWTTAETKLAAQPQQVAESLYNSNGPVPVDGSTQSAPVTKQISQISSQTKDELGNVTGTQIETKTVKVEDTSTTTEVTYNVTEITTITNYNENNQITSTQTSTADTEQPKAAEDTDISFDNVSDVQLDTEEIDVQLETPVSWGEGTCPPDETLTLQGRSYAISYEPACEAAADLRPIFVLLASVTALFIVAGVSRSRGE
ncbi:hypothetical protein Nstercoris_01996 [Nitrosomonas stercoris]|uniref:TspB protein n=1 Tax=Nitrosomonas stercoris TaxID=1444684 RepID=A0A4Y1YRE9_9PROT|nr:hypothetical protein Nstercoris_01996 [Nitrosomonas stercoris]